MLLLYVDDLSLTENRNSLKLQEEACCRVLNAGLGHDTLFSKHGGVAKCIWNFPRTREIYNRDSEEIQDDGVQGHDHTYGIGPKTID